MVLVVFMSCSIVMLTDNEQTILPAHVSQTFSPLVAGLAALVMDDQQINAAALEMCLGDREVPRDKLRAIPPKRQWRNEPL